MYLPSDSLIHYIFILISIFVVEWKCAGPYIPKVGSNVINNDGRIHGP